MQWVEAIAVVFGFVCVWLTVKENIYCWPTGLIQVILYIFIFYHVQLYSDLILQIIYVIMQIYGWYHWLHGGKNKTELSVSRLKYTELYGWIFSGIIISGIWGYLMRTYTNAAAPYCDAFIAAMSLIAQWLMARKKLESWFFWIAIDVMAVGVYFYKQLYMTTGLYFVFFILAITGFIEWRKTFVRNKNTMCAAGNT
jgi:nicotinamide mononucleotide transporter